MQVLQTPEVLLLGWLALSLIVAAGWSRFMVGLRRSEQQMADELVARRRRPAVSPSARRLAA